VVAVSAARSQHIVVIAAYPESLVNFRGALLRSLVERGHRVSALAAPAAPELVQRIEALGVRFLSYPVARNAMNPEQDLRTFQALRVLLRETQPDVILAYTIKPVIWGALAARSVPSARFVALITGLGMALVGTGLKRRVLTWFVERLYKGALRRATTVIFQNEDDRSRFVDRRLVEFARTARVWGSGVELERFTAAPPPDGPMCFMLVARLLQAKGVREFAAAAAMVRREHPSARFVIVGGDDPSADRIDPSEVEGWVRDGTVEWTGQVSDVRAKLRECHVFVLPSNYPEGLPRSVLEAMATGRAIITTTMPGCRDTVQVGVNGFLVPPRDAAALAERMRWCIAHPTDVAEMGRASRRFAEERFDVHKVNAEMRRLMGLADA
jgi:glycosyltransferase involved in cell wall biosynthesis